MIAFANMLLAPAEQAGIKTPADTENYSRDEFPHFAVFSSIQLGTPMPTPTSHWHNAKVIAGIAEDKIRLVTGEDLTTLGIEVGFPIP